MDSTREPISFDPTEGAEEEDQLNVTFTEAINQREAEARVANANARRKKIAEATSNIMKSWSIRTALKQRIEKPSG